MLGSLFSFGGGLLVVVIYLAILAVVAAVLYFVVRLAVLHALKLHTRWVDAGKP